MPCTIETIETIEPDPDLIHDLHALNLAVEGLVSPDSAVLALLRTLDTTLERGAAVTVVTKSPS